MKNLKKIILVIVILLVLVIGAVAAIPFVFKDQIVKLVKEELNNQLTATVDFNDDLSIGIFKSFPNLSVGLKDFSVIGQDSFQGDTLLYSKTINSSINLRDLWKDNHLTLNGLQADNPVINLISKSNQSNWDIFKPTDDETESVSVGADFEKIIFNHGRITYTDSAIAFGLHDLSGNISGKFAEDVFDAKTVLDCQKTSLVYDGIAYIEDLPAKADGVIQIDLNNDKYTFSENQIYTGQLLLSLDGDMKFDENDDMIFNLTFGSSKAPFQEFLSLIPSLYRNDLADFKANGTASVKGDFKGLYSDKSFPAYNLSVLVENGDLKYSSVPEKLTNIGLDLEITNADGQDDNLVVNLKNLGFVLNQEPFNAKALLKTMVSDPFVEGEVKGKVHLKDLARVLPAENNLLMQGDIMADLVFKGYPKSLSQKNISRFNASGFFKTKDLAYSSNDLPNKIEIPVAELRFNNDAIDVPTLKITSGRSDLLFGGNLSNAFAYLFGGGVLKGNLRLNSQQFRESDFVKPSPENASKNEVVAETESSPFILPANVDITIEGNIDELEYGDNILKHATSKANIQNGILQVEYLTSEFLGGNVNISGDYNTQNVNDIRSDLTLTARQFDISTVFKKFETIRILAPVAEYAKGKFSTTFKINTRLKPDFSPDLTDIDCSGILDLFDCDLKGLKVFNKIGDKLKNDAFSKPIKLNDFLLSFSIEDGKVKLKPFELPILGGAKLQIGGETSLDKSIDFSGLLTIPKSMYQQNVDAYKSYVPQNRFVDLNDVEYQNLIFDIDILGKMGNPEVKLNFQNLKKGLKDQLADKVKNEIDEQRRLAEEKARQEIDKAKLEAEKKRQEAEDAARKKLEEEKKKAEEQLEKEKEAARKKLQDDLKKRTGGLIKPK